MPRKRINEKAPLSNAEKQRRYRAKQKAQGKVRAWADTAAGPAPDIVAIRERGRIIGICEAAAFFIENDRADIARCLLSHFMIGRRKAETALQTDRQTRDITLASLDESGAWEKPPV